MKELYSLNEIEVAVEKCYKYPLKLVSPFGDKKRVNEIDVINHVDFMKHLRSDELNHDYRLKGKFTEEFFEEFQFDSEFRAIFESIVRGMSPFEAIEHLCKAKKEIMTHLNRAIELGGVKVDVNRVSGDGVFFRCSKCEYEPNMDGKTDDLLSMNYCPSCGSKFKSK